MQKKRILTVFGTRPEAIKMAPLIKALALDDDFEVKVAVTAQHREMLDQVLRLFAVTPDYDLDIMERGQSLAAITTKVLNGVSDILAVEKPDLLLVHGDTTTTLAAALAGFYSHVPVGHVEAGLRTGQKLAPWPEELNRRLADVIADLYFAPTAVNRNNLLAEGINAQKIFVTGNTVIDALLTAVKEPCDLNDHGLAAVDWSRRIILLTCHRRENWGSPMAAVFRAVRAIKVQRPTTEIIYPVHKNPAIRDLAADILGDVAGIHLIEPLDYHPFCTLMNKSHLILTDSGGVQEEAPSLGKPVLVLRDVTERPEAVAAGTVKLAGTDEDTIKKEVFALFDDDALYQEMAQRRNPYGDGRAATKIVQIIKNFDYKSLRF